MNARFTKPYFARTVHTGPRRGVDGDDRDRRASPPGMVVRRNGQQEAWSQDTT
jgi:hypothetical protein